MKNIFVSFGSTDQIIKTSAIQYFHQAEIKDEFGKYIGLLGKKVLISGGTKALRSIENPLITSLEKSEIDWEKIPFHGECCSENISVIADKIAETKPDVMVGIGGGKSLDTAKAAASATQIPIVCIPTIAATCAAVTPVSILYSREGAFKQILYLPASPNLVMVDTSVIAKAPKEYLVSGIFDALAKWYEGRAIFSTIKEPDTFTIAALKLAQLLNQQMEEKAIKAIESVMVRKAADQVRDVIDLNIYVTGMIQGLGFFTLRGGAAHPVHNGLTVLKESHHLLHGDKVGYGILIQQFLENRPMNEIERIVSFFRALGLHPSLKGLGIPSNRKAIQKIAEKACIDEDMGKMPFPVTEEMVISAINRLEELAEGT